MTKYFIDRKLRKQCDTLYLMWFGINSIFTDAVLLVLLSQFSYDKKKLKANKQSVVKIIT